MTPTPIPENILNMLNEHSRGGFFLFRINGNGEPEFSVQFDDTVSYLGLASYAQKVLRSLESLDSESIERELIGEEIDESGEPT